MKLSAKALAIVTAALWGGCLLVVGMANLIFPSYGVDFLRAVSSVYVGYDAAPRVGSVLIGTIWGIADGAVGGFLFGWLYNLVAGRMNPSVRETV
jgi:hypothetical protein